MLQGNELTSLPTRLNLRRLKRLDLGDNQLSNIEPCAFCAAPHLNSLGLERNQLVKDLAAAFPPRLPSLTLLQLEGNQVEQELAKRQAVLKRIATTVDQLSASMEMGLSGETSSIADVRNAITQANVGLVAATDKGQSKIEKVGDGVQVNIQELVSTLAKEVTHQSEQLALLDEKVKSDLDHLAESSSNKMLATVKDLGKLDR